MAKEKNTGQNREEYIKNLIAGNYSKPTPPPTVEPVPDDNPKPDPAPVEQEKRQEPSKESPRRKRGISAPDYKESFLQKNEIKTRQCVYISQQVHEVISEIVRVIANKDISVGGYIDTVLLQHLEEHKDEINELYRRDRDNLIR